MNRKKLMSIASAAVFTIVSASFAAMSAFAEEAADTASSTQQTTSQGSFFTLILPLIIMFALLYFIAIRPQKKKRDKELKEMQDSLQVGDEVVTGGGIVGMVVSVGEDTVVIETGGAKHKLRIKNWAITENVTAMERAKAAKAAGSAKKSKDAGMASAAVVDDDSAEKKSKKKKKDEE